MQRKKIQAKKLKQINLWSKTQTTAYMRNQAKPHELFNIAIFHEASLLCAL